MAHEEKTITIIVNGQPHELPKDKEDKEISYEEVVTLAFPDYPQHPETTYAVKYKNGHSNKPEGILAPGATVKVKKEMIFSVSPTGQS